MERTEVYQLRGQHRKVEEDLRAQKMATRWVEQNFAAALERVDSKTQIQLLLRCRIHYPTLPEEWPTIFTDGTATPRCLWDREASYITGTPPHQVVRRVQYAELGQDPRGNIDFHLFLCLLHEPTQGEMYDELRALMAKDHGC